MLAEHSTFYQYLIAARAPGLDARGDLNAVLLNVALACKAIARRVSLGALREETAPPHPRDPTRKQLAAIAHDLFFEGSDWSDLVASRASKAMDAPQVASQPSARGPYLLVLDPLEGSHDIDFGMPVGSFFSVLRAPERGRAPRASDFLQPGARQVCAGYAIYGTSTMLVLTVGAGVHGFTLHPELGEFFLTHPSLRIPSTTGEFAINASNSRFWEPAVKRYVDECVAGRSGPRGRDFTMRWTASLVAELHRILLRGGVFLDPRTGDHETGHGGVHLLFDGNPVSFLVEQADGLSSCGRGRILDVVPEQLQQRTGLVFGSREEVARIEQYHRDRNVRAYDAPLFGSRGLFRSPS